MSNDNKLCLVLLDEVGDMVKAVFDNNGLLGFRRLSLSFSLSLLDKSLFLGGFVLWPVLEKDLEQAGCKILVEGLGELVKGRWDLQPLLKDALLPLKTDGLGPFDVASKILLGRKSSTYTKLLRPSLKERVCYFIRLLLGSNLDSFLRGLTRK